MLPGEDPARIEAWMDRYGREFDQMTPLHEQAMRGQAPPLGPFGARIERVLRSGSRGGGWVMEGLEARAQGGTGLVALFRREGRSERLAILIEPRDPARKAFAHTRELNVSYLQQWQGRSCGFDEGLIRDCLRRLARAETGDEPGSGA
jgi:hypothetical protein